MVTASAQSATVTANFTQLFLVSTYTADPGDYYTSTNGKITVTPTSDGCGDPTDTDCYYEAGTQLTFHAQGAGTFAFTGWTGDLHGNENVAALKVTDQVLVRANFLQPGRLVRDNVRNAGNGGNLAVSPGELVTLSGYQFGPPKEVVP